jgi:hypothetical protein
MSDGASDIERDKRIRGALNDVLKKWVMGQDYSVDMAKLRSLPRGYWWPSGDKVASEYAAVLTAKGLSTPVDRMELLSERFDVSKSRLKRMLGV